MLHQTLGDIFVQPRCTKPRENRKLRLKFDEKLRMEIPTNFVLLFSQNCVGNLGFPEIRSGLFVRENANGRGEEDLDWDLDSNDEGTPGCAGGCNR